MPSKTILAGYAFCAVALLMIVSGAILALLS
jgi:hypothetical protein